MSNRILFPLISVLIPIKRKALAIAKLVALISASIWLAGCMSTGFDHSSHDKISQITAGQTTELELIEMFGQPSQREIQPEGKVMLRWERTGSKRQSAGFIPYAGTMAGVRDKEPVLAVTLDHGKVENASYAGGPVKLDSVLTFLTAASDSEADQNATYSFGLVTRDDEPVAIYAAGDRHSLESLTDWKPIVVRRKFKFRKTIIFIRLMDFDPRIGGAFEICSLREYFTVRRDDYRLFAMELRKDENWAVVVENGDEAEPVDRMELKTRYRGKDEVGIAAFVFYNAEQIVATVDTERLPITRSP